MGTFFSTHLFIQIAFDALFGEQSVSSFRSLKYHQLAVEYLSLIVAKCSDKYLPSFGPILFSGLKKIIDTSEVCVHKYIYMVILFLAHTGGGYRLPLVWQSWQTFAASH